MMNRGEQIKTFFLKFQHRPAKALVIVDDVVVTAMRHQVFIKAATKAIRFGKTTRQLTCPLNNIT